MGLSKVRNEPYLLHNATLLAPLVTKWRSLLSVRYVAVINCLMASFSWKLSMILYAYSI